MRTFLGCTLGGLDTSNPATVAAGVSGSISRYSRVDRYVRRRAGDCVSSTRDLSSDRFARSAEGMETAEVRADERWPTLWLSKCGVPSGKFIGLSEAGSRPFILYSKFLVPTKSIVRVPGATLRFVTNEE